MKKIYVFTPIFLILVIVFTGIVPIITQSESISEKVFRLHIIANSDSDSDQALKLKVRDEILKASRQLFSNCSSVEEARRRAENNIESFTSVANETISKYGYDYSVRVFTDKEYFDTRKYDGFTLPAGIYNCLKIVIGAGKGHNWWCVMFPAVCISGCTDSFDGYLSEDEKNLIENDKYIIKFKIVEIYEELINK